MNNKYGIKIDLFSRKSIYIYLDCTAMSEVFYRLNDKCDSSVYYPDCISVLYMLKQFTSQAIFYSFRWCRAKSVILY